MVLAHTIVEAPKNGAISRAAAISAPSVDAPTTKTRSSSGGSPRRRGGSVLEEAEIGLAGPADGAEPVIGDVLERRPRRDAAVGIAVGGVIDEPARLADPLLGGTRRGHALIVGSPAHGGRPARPRRGAQPRGGHASARGRHRDRAAGWRGDARGAARQAQPRAALHGGRVGVPGRRGGPGRGPPRGRRARGGGGGGRGHRRSRRARRVLPLDHPATGQDPLRHALLPRSRARRRAAAPRRRRDRRSRVVHAPGRARGVPSGGDRARVPHHQDARAARAVRVGVGVARVGARARGRRNRAAGGRRGRGGARRPAGRARLRGMTELRPETRLVHGGRPSEGPLSVPVVLTAPYRDSGYAREEGSPTWEALEAALGALEGGQTVAFSSGMAAIAATLDHLPVGARVVGPAVGYTGSRGLLADRAATGRIALATVDLTDTEAVLRACEGAALAWVETPTNPMVGVVELDRVCEAARAAGCEVVVDATFATPL